MNKNILVLKKTLMTYINPAFYRPEAARLIITQNCPLRCKMCTFWQQKWPEPSLELVKYWVRELADFGIKNIDIGGGEPFVREDLTEIVNEIKSYE